MTINEIHEKICELTNELLLTYMCSRRNIRMQYDNLHRKNANRKKTLKQLNKAIKRKNKRIAELEEANKELTKFITTFKFSPFDFMFKYTNGNEQQ